MTREACALALLCAACAPSATPVAPPNRSVSVPSASASGAANVAPPEGAAPQRASREQRLIARMLRHVTAARGIDANKAVPGVVLDRKALIGRVRDHVSKELPPEAIHNEGLTLQLLGFVPTQFDYEASEYRLLEDQLAGYYEPADGTMYMASDLPDEEADATLAHELVHALQDQRWNLQSRSKYRPGDGDRSEAVSSLAEGDATSAMFDVILSRAAPGAGKTAMDLPDDVFMEQIRAGMSQGPGANAPHIMRSSLAAPYVYGTLFVHALRRRGGWDAVNRAWDDPPATTEQILHVDKWLAHEAPMKIAAPAFASLGSGWRVADEDSEGELGARVAFEEWMDVERAAEASAGWGGDRGVLATNGDAHAFAWRMRYEPGKTKDDRAKKAFVVIARALDEVLGAPKATDASFDCHERADRGPLAVARAGADFVLVAGPAHTASKLWSSAGDCKGARAWVKEITAAP